MLLFLRTHYDVNVKTFTTRYYFKFLRTHYDVIVIVAITVSS